jgi:sulfite exporter TauE/SafE
MIQIAFLFGLLGSVHCLGMCGPIAFLLPLNHKNKIEKLLQVTMYHMGRLFSYALIGFALSLIGKNIALFGLQQHLSIATGILMILFVLYPKFKIPFLQKTVHQFLSKLQNKLSQQLKRKKGKLHFLSIGILNGFLPCGFVYMAVLGSLAYGNSANNSVLFMIAFGLGTVPLMTSVVYAFHLFSVKTQQTIRQQFPVLVIILAGLFILRGLGLDIPYLSPAPIDFVTNKINCH